MSQKIMSARLRLRRGASAVEYGILAALIAGAITLGVTDTGVNLANLFGGFAKSAEGVVAPSSSSGATFSAFNIFTTAPASVYEGTCSGGVMPVFQSSASDVNLSTGNCANTSYTASGLSSLLLSLPVIVLTSPSGTAAVSVPALDGPGTGFTAPVGQNIFVDLYKAGSGAGQSFLINSPTGLLTSANLKSAASACAAEGGTFAANSGSANCNGGTLYPTNVSTLLISGQL